MSTTQRPLTAFDAEFIERLTVALADSGADATGRDHYLALCGALSERNAAVHGALARAEAHATGTERMGDMDLAAIERLVTVVLRARVVLQATWMVRWPGSDALLFMLRKVDADLGRASQAFTLVPCEVWEGFIAAGEKVYSYRGWVGDVCIRVVSASRCANA